MFPIIILLEMNKNNKKKLYTYISVIKDSSRKMHEKKHYNDVIMDTMASQITSLTIVYSSVYSCAYQRKYQSFVSLAFVRGIHRQTVNSPHKRPVTRKLWPFDDVIMRKMINDEIWQGKGPTKYCGLKPEVRKINFNCLWQEHCCTFVECINY